ASKSPSPTKFSSLGGKGRVIPMSVPRQDFRHRAAARNRPAGGASSIPERRHSSKGPDGVNATPLFGRRGHWPRTLFVADQEGSCWQLCLWFRNCREQSKRIIINNLR